MSKQSQSCLSCYVSKLSYLRLPSEILIPNPVHPHHYLLYILLIKPANNALRNNNVRICHTHLKGLSLGHGKDLQKRGSSSSPPGQAGSPLHKSIRSRHNVLVWQRAILSWGQGPESVVINISNQMSMVPSRLWLTSHHAASVYLNCAEYFTGQYNSCFIWIWIGCIMNDMIKQATHLHSHTCLVLAMNDLISWTQNILVWQEAIMNSLDQQRPSSAPFMHCTIPSQMLLVAVHWLVTSPHQ